MTICNFYSLCDSLQVLVIIGAASLYVFIGLMLYLASDRMLSKEIRMLLVFLWPVMCPLMLFAGAVYLIGMWIIFPFIGATKKDLRETEARMTEKIATVKKVQEPKAKILFSVGDLITGKKGNPGEYKHLNEGCVCRVLKIDEKGSMQVRLLDHKNFKEQQKYVGNTYKAPSRKFVAYKKSKK